jgi:hypothetical protein
MQPNFHSRLRYTFRQHHMTIGKLDADRGIAHNPQQSLHQPSIDLLKCTHSHPANLVSSRTNIRNE